MTIDDIVLRSASDLGLPSWWVRNIITEYIRCRRFALGYPFWEFDETMVTEANIVRAVDAQSVVTSDAVVHNVRRDVFSHRLMRRMISLRSEPLSTESDSYFPEGLIGPNNFEWSTNPIADSDPKLNFSRWFQARDDDGIFQWEVARFETVEGRHFGRWVSDHVDLAGIEEVDVRHRELADRCRTTGSSSVDLKEIEEFYEWVESIRQPIREALWVFHLERKSRPWRNTAAETEPPMLSSAEDFTVKDGVLKTSFNADALFFDACRRYSRQGGRPVASLDGAEDVLFARVEAVINAAACLEAFVNSVGSDLMSEFTEEYDRLPIVAKWRLCLRATGHADMFDPSREPYQTLQKVVYLRNQWMHNHREYKRVRTTNTGTVTWIEAQMDPLFIERLPEQLLDLLRGLSMVTGKMPGWLVPGSTSS